jgi:hypothetical protein
MALLSAPHLRTVSLHMQRLLSWLGEQVFLRRFYLAGGTALALQIGHRRSMYLDFFSEVDEVHTQSRQEIISALSGRENQVIESADGNLLLLVDEIRVGFFSYGYSLLEPTLKFNNIRLASLLDLGLMKLDALAGRGSRKDFYDLYLICQQIPLTDLFSAGERKYPQVRDFALMAVESLVRFENADQDFQPEMLMDLPWESVKQFFFEQAKELGKLWFFAK